MIFINTSNKDGKYLFVYFCQIFADKRLSRRRSKKGAVYCSSRRALSDSYFGKALLINFAITWNSLLEHCSSAEYLLMKDYVQGALLMELPIATFAEHFKITYSGKVFLISFFDTSNKLLKHCIFTDSLLIVNYIQGVLRKELLIAPLVEPLKMLLWESLTDRIYQYLEQFT